MSTIKTTTLSTQGGSTVPVDTVVNGTAKAWVNFNGQGTVAIRRAFNVSSITDQSSGNYVVNFTTAMPDTNYTAVVSSVRTASWTNGGDSVAIHTLATTGVTMSHVENGNALDPVGMSAVIFS